MLHRNHAASDSDTAPVGANGLAETLRESLYEIQQIKSRLTDLQEQITGVLMALPQPDTPSRSSRHAVASSVEPSDVCDTRVFETGVTQSGRSAVDDSWHPSKLSDFGTGADNADKDYVKYDNANGRISDSIDLQKWLQDRGVTVRQLVSPSPFEASFDLLAVQLGRDYEYLADFYLALKRRIGGSVNPKSLPLKNYSGERINRVVQFGEELRRNGFLKDFRYVRASRTILFDPQTDGHVTNFFTGNWLERYVVITVTQHLRRLYPERSIEILTNPRIVLPDGNDFELDVLIACDAIVLWFECKTGKDFPAYLAKYSAVAKKVMQLGFRHAAMILLEDLTDREKSNNSQIAGMSVLNLGDVQRFLSTIHLPESGVPAIWEAWPNATDSADGDQATVDPATTTVGSSGAKIVRSVQRGDVACRLATRPQIPAQPALSVPPGQMTLTHWLAILNREQLRPLDPRLRRNLITAFARIGSNLEQATPLRGIVNRLAIQCANENDRVSKAMINDVARALYRSGCCELAPHDEFPNKVWFLRPDLDPDVAFDDTAKLYLWAGIKSRETFQIESPETLELGRVIWGFDVADETLVGQIDRAVMTMQTEGRCSIDHVANRSNVTAIGDRFWNQPQTVAVEETAIESPAVEEPFGDQSG